MRLAWALAALTVSCSAATLTVYHPMVHEQHFTWEFCSHVEFCGPSTGSNDARIDLPSVTFDVLSLPPGSEITSARLSYYSDQPVPMITSFTESYGPLCAEPCDWERGFASFGVVAAADGTINGRRWAELVNLGSAETTQIYPDAGPLLEILQEDRYLVINTTLFPTVFPAGLPSYNGWEYYKVDWLVRLTGNWKLELDYIAPVPEPATFAAVAAGLLAVIGVGRKRLEGSKRPTDEPGI